MNFADIQQDLRNAKEFLKPVLQVDNAHENNGSIISWRRYIPGIGRNTYYPLEYQHLIDNHQYSFLLRDGSFFQFYYEFSSNQLISGRAAYYPTPMGTFDSQDDLVDGAESALDQDRDDLYQHLLNVVDLMEADKLLPANTSHVRFDFDQLHR